VSLEESQIMAAGKRHKGKKARRREEEKLLQALGLAPADLV